MVCYYLIWKGHGVNNNVELCSDWLFHSTLMSVAQTANRSLLSGVNDGEIRHPILSVWACIRRIYRFWEILQESLASMVWRWSLWDTGGVNEAWERFGVSEGYPTHVQLLCCQIQLYTRFRTCLFTLFDTLEQWFSIPVLGTPFSAHFACLPYLTHLIEIISLLGERAMNWTNELMSSIRCFK